MGATVSHQTTPALRSSYFIMDRIIAANCDYLKDHSQPNIIIGVYNSPNSLNPLGRQGIRIGDGEIYSLLTFQKTENSVNYEFENSTHLTIFKRNNSQICYNLKTPSLNITREIAPKIASLYKDLSLDSRELDEIKEIMQ